MASPASLDELVRAELRPAVAAVVRQLVLDLAREEVARLTANGAGAIEHERGSGSAANGAVKTCSRCGQTKPADQFQRQRRQCRDCRNTLVQAMRRRQADAPDPAQPTGA
jgi:hypothetical protein